MEKEHISLGPGSENVIEEVETFTYLGDTVDRDEVWKEQCVEEWQRLGASGVK